METRSPDDIEPREKTIDIPSRGGDTDEEDEQRWCYVCGCGGHLDLTLEGLEKRVPGSPNKVPTIADHCTYHILNNLYLQPFIKDNKLKILHFSC